MYYNIPNFILIFVAKNVIFERYHVKETQQIHEQNFLSSFKTVINFSLVPLREPRENFYAKYIIYCPLGRHQVSLQHCLEGWQLVDGLQCELFDLKVNYFNTNYFQITGTKFNYQISYWLVASPVAVVGSRDRCAAGLQPPPPTWTRQE